MPGIQQSDAKFRLINDHLLTQCISHSREETNVVQPTNNLVAEKTKPHIHQLIQSLQNDLIRQQILNTLTLSPSLQLKSILKCPFYE